MRRSVRFASVVVAGVTTASLAALPASASGPGSLDPAFGDNGRVDRDFGSNLPERGDAFAMQSDGKLLVAGGQDDGANGHFAVARYTPSGRFDQTFGDHGRVVLDVGPDTAATSAAGVAVTAAGKIVLGGSTGDGDFEVARLRSDGTPDPSFNGTGVMTFGFGAGSGDEVFGVAVQRDGSIVVVGSANHNDVGVMAVARVNTSGHLDSGFNGDGRVKVTFGVSTSQEAGGVAVLANGHIAVIGDADMGGSRGRDLALAVFKPNGQLDPNVSGDGKATADEGGNEYGYKIAETPSGKLVVSGETDVAGNECDWALARFLPGGTLDHTFSGDGRVITRFGPFCAIASGLMLESDGKVVAVGSAGNDGGFRAAVARYLTNGSLDPAFSGDGKVVTSFGEGDGEYWGAAETANGRIVAGGRTNHSGAEQGNFALARYFA